MSVRGPLLGMAALVVVVGCGVVIGGPLGVGPLAATTPPDQVTDPREMVARSLQSVLDASAFHVEATVDGTVPGAIVDRPGGAVSLDGTIVTADIKPRDLRTQASVTSDPLEVDLDTVTVWGDIWSRTVADGPWTKSSLGSLAADASFDANPLTLVDRLRAYVSEPDHRPTTADVACAAPSGTCHRLVFGTGSDPSDLLAALLPDANAAALSEVTTTVTLDTDAKTLRPARLVLELARADGSVDLRVVIDISRWDEQVQIEEPPGS
ncbi:MAG TPA: LppX_LprAFG lipoprotein [Candidatus Limnocylindrales bacterium]|nr:LppX_LprAFG lipoprotein [Candidatus Limnocylindrales bacterium]